MCVCVCECACACVCVCGGGEGSWRGYVAEDVGREYKGGNCG